MPEDISRVVYQRLLKRSAASPTRSVRAAELVRRIASELGLGVLEAREALRTLRAEGLIGYTPDLDGGPYTGYLVVTAVDAPPPPSLVRWREAMAAEIGDLVLTDLLMPCHSALSDLAVDDLRRVARGLLQLPALMNSASPSFGFSLSARGILGSSKLLGCIPEAARRHLGIASLPASPRYVVVAGPSEPKAVLLVENPTSFEEVVRIGWATEIAFVVAYGYGLNMSADSTAGWNLVDGLINGRFEVINRTAGQHRLDALLNHPNVFYWGDLDREGLRIAAALGQRLPTLRLSALYIPMLRLVADRETSHPYSEATGKSNQMLWRPMGDELLDALAMSCSDRAVDQEAVDLSNCLPLAMRALVATDLPSVVHGVTDCIGLDADKTAEDGS